MNWYLEPLRKYAVFQGRATRKEFWIFILANYAIAAVLIFLPSLLYTVNDELFASALYFTGLSKLLIFGLIVFIPSLAVTVRRLHDTNRSAWWLLLPFGVPVFLVIAATALISYSSWTQNNSIVDVIVNMAIYSELLIFLGSTGGIGLLITLLVFIFLLCKAGSPEANRYGPPCLPSESAAPHYYIR